MSSNDSFLFLFQTQYTFKNDSHLDIFSPNTNVCRLSVLQGGGGKLHREAGEGGWGDPDQQVCMNRIIETVHLKHTGQLKG